MSRRTRVPLGVRLAAWCLPPDVRDEVLRELLEQHAHLRATRGWCAAWRWSVAQPWAAWTVRDPASPDAAWRGVARDLALVPRTLRRRPTLAVSVVATMALAVASVSAMASVVDAVLLRPLPFPDPDRVVWISSHQTGAGRAPFDPASASRASANPLDVVDWQRRERHLTALTPFETFESTIEAAARPIRVDVASVRSAIGQVFGVPALHGRLFDRDDEAPGARAGGRSASAASSPRSSASSATSGTRACGRSRVRRCTSRARKRRIPATSPGSPSGRRRIPRRCCRRCGAPWRRSIRRSRSTASRR
jgi:hypothetical protein